MSDFTLYSLKFFTLVFFTKMYTNRNSPTLTHYALESVKRNSLLLNISVYSHLTTYCQKL